VPTTAADAYDFGVAAPEDFRGLTVADVMLRDPKTLPGSATVHEVRSMLRNPSVQMVLLADERVFRGAITEIPDEAADDHVALRYADLDPDSLAPSEPAPTAFDVTAKSPHRRVVVLDERNALLGLVCLDKTLTHFCGRPRAK
jgi:CBS-domain-containing membrane protein